MIQEKTIKHKSAKVAGIVAGIKREGRKHFAAVYTLKDTSQKDGLFIFRPVWQEITETRFLDYYEELFYCPAGQAQVKPKGVEHFYALEPQLAVIRLAGRIAIKEDLVDRESGKIIAMAGDEFTKHQAILLIMAGLFEAAIRNSTDADTWEEIGSALLQRDLAMVDA